VIKRESDLLINLLLFSHVLRNHKLIVTVDNVIDVLRGISFIHLQRREDFYLLLRSNFVCKKEEMNLFNDLFEDFWCFEDRTKPSRLRPSKELPCAVEEEEQNFPAESGKGQSLIQDGDVPGKRDGSPEQKDEWAYSPKELLSQKDFARLKREELDVVKESVLHLTRRISAHLSRRRKRGIAGDQIDFRRSMRRSIKYGGEMMELRMKKPKPKPLHLIFICDVSGSMDIYSQFFLLFMYGLQNYYPRCETFTFSTRLNHVSSLLQRRPFEEALCLLSEKVLDWAGGTDIGFSLHQFHQRHSELLHPNQTLVLILSDGWDRGDSRVLDSEMKHIRENVKGIVWLNPLLESRGYRPLCKGMLTALPYLDHFLPCHSLSNLKDLGLLISKGGFAFSRSFT